MGNKSPVGNDVDINNRFEFEFNKFKDLDNPQAPKLKRDSLNEYPLEPRERPLFIKKEDLNEYPPQRRYWEFSQPYDSSENSFHIYRNKSPYEEAESEEEYMRKLRLNYELEQLRKEVATLKSLEERKRNIINHSDKMHNENIYKLSHDSKSSTLGIKPSFGTSSPGPGKFVYVHNPREEPELKENMDSADWERPISHSTTENSNTKPLFYKNIFRKLLEPENSTSLGKNFYQQPINNNTYKKKEQPKRGIISTKPDSNLGSKSKSPFARAKNKYGGKDTLATDERPKTYAEYFFHTPEKKNLLFLEEMSFSPPIESTKKNIKPNFISRTKIDSFSEKKPAKYEENLALTNFRKKVLALNESQRDSQAFKSKAKEPENVDHFLLLDLEEFCQKNVEKIVEHENKINLMQADDQKLLYLGSVKNELDMRSEKINRIMGLIDPESLGESQLNRLKKVEVHKNNLISLRALIEETLEKNFEKKAPSVKTDKAELPLVQSQNLRAKKLPTGSESLPLKVNIIIDEGPERNTQHDSKERPAVRSIPDFMLSSGEIDHLIERAIKAGNISFTSNEIQHDDGNSTGEFFIPKRNEKNISASSFEGKEVENNVMGLSKIEENQSALGMESFEKNFFTKSSVEELSDSAFFKNNGNITEDNIKQPTVMHNNNESMQNESVQNESNLKKKIKELSERSQEFSNKARNSKIGIDPNFHQAD